MGGGGQTHNNKDEKTGLNSKAWNNKNSSFQKFNQRQNMSRVVKSSYRFFCKEEFHLDLTHDKDGAIMKEGIQNVHLYLAKTASVHSHDKATNNQKTLLFVENKVVLYEAFLYFDN